MRLRLAFLTGLVALFFAQAAAAAPAVKLRPVGTVQDGSALFGDGDRFAAWQYGTSVTILDDHGGRRKLTLDQACAPAEPSVRAAGAGKLLVAACPGHGPS